MFICVNMMYVHRCVFVCVVEGWGSVMWAYVCVWERILSYAPLTWKQHGEAAEDRTTTVE